jgi:NAD(P)H-hydrate epimerase
MKLRSTLQKWHNGPSKNSFRFLDGLQIVVFAGGGNNGADAMVLARSIIIMAQAGGQDSLLVLAKEPACDEYTPRSQSYRALCAMDIKTISGERLEKVENIFPTVLTDNLDQLVIIDGIAGTGLKGPLRGMSADWVNAINKIKREMPARVTIVSVDIPSGLYAGLQKHDPVIRADVTLAIEPAKDQLYTPGGRLFTGVIEPVGAIFPQKLIDRFCSIDLFAWPQTSAFLPPIPPDAHKYTRGLCEIHAGSRGSAGAALIAANGAQAAGAGIVRLIVDDSIYAITAQAAGTHSPGIMVTTESIEAEEYAVGRFKPDAILLGPGWGAGENRRSVFETALRKEAAGTPLILDADALKLARNSVFSGNAILTPHPGEFAVYTGISKDVFSHDPRKLLEQTSRTVNAVIIYKSHVLWIAAPDGRLGVVDGMTPALGMGGSGDLLAGLCAALAARARKSNANYDPYPAAVCAASLLVAAGKRLHHFADPVHAVSEAAALAGNAWLVER